MEEMILNLIPSLSQSPTLLIVCEVLLYIYFGGVLFNLFVGLFNGYRSN